MYKRLQISLHRVNHLSNHVQKKVDEILPEFRLDIEVHIPIAEPDVHNRQEAVAYAEQLVKAVVRQKW